MRKFTRPKGGEFSKKGLILYTDIKSSVNVDGSVPETFILRRSLPEMFLENGAEILRIDKTSHI